MIVTMKKTIIITTTTTIMKQPYQTQERKNVPNENVLHVNIGSYKQMMNLFKNLKLKH